MANRQPRWVEPFLKALEQTGNVRQSAERVGVDFTSAYQRRKRHLDFDQRWAEAVKRCRDRLYAQLEERDGQRSGGRGGVPTPPSAAFASATSPNGEELIARPDGKLARVGEGRWSKRSEESFLIALTISGSVSRAAKAAGFSTAALYKRRLKDRHFAQAWDAALETGKARVQSLLVEAATRTFDPDELPIAEDQEIPKVTVGEAINIAKMPARTSEGSRSGGAVRGRWYNGRFVADDEEMNAEERQEVTERILDKLEGLKSRNDREMVEAGWTEHEVPPEPWRRDDGPSSVWIPPGWRLVGPGE